MYAPQLPPQQNFSHKYIEQRFKKTLKTPKIEANLNRQKVFILWLAVWKLYNQAQKLIQHCFYATQVLLDALDAWNKAEQYKDSPFLLQLKLLWRSAGIKAQKNG